LVKDSSNQTFLKYWKRITIILPTLRDGLKHTNYNSDIRKYTKETDPITQLLKLKILPPTDGKPLEYKYKYNGKEWQDELGLNFYDYGARNYDPALGRWMNMDALSEKYYSESPFNYVVNNPVNMIDPDGNFIVSAAFAAKYPKITHYLKYNLKSDIMGSSKILEELAKNTNGNLTSKIMDEITTFDSGPMIVSSKNPGGGFGEVKPNGFYDHFDTGNIELLDTRLQFLEDKLACIDCDNEEKLQALLGIFMLIIHETSHYGDWLDGRKDNTKEVGDKTEYDIWWYNDQGIPYVESERDKFIPAAQIEIINEKRNKGVLPTVPEYPGSAGPADDRKNKSTEKN